MSVYGVWVRGHASVPFVPADARREREEVVGKRIQPPAEPEWYWSPAGGHCTVPVGGATAGGTSAGDSAFERDEGGRSGAGGAAKTAADGRHSNAPWGGRLTTAFLRVLCAGHAHIQRLQRV